MSMPGFIRAEIHRMKEAQEAQTPYDPKVPSRVVLKNPQETQTSTVWDENPWDSFERKVVLAYTGNRQRIDLLTAEFARVGLTGVEVLWNFNDHYLKLYENVKCVNFTPSWLALLNNALGHYRIIKSSYELGCRNCLIMEDDIRFLRDVTLLADILSDAPHDYEVLMLDSLGPAGEGDKVSGYWRKVVNRTSAACYALDRRGMEKFIEIYENTIYPSDHNFNSKNFSQIYYAFPNVARQVSVCGSKTNTHYENWSQFYDQVVCPRGKYGK